MFFSRMNVAARLYWGFGLIVALLVVLTAVAVVKVDRIERALRANMEIYSQVQRNAINFRGSAHDRSIALRDAVLSPSVEERERELATIQELADFYTSSARTMDTLLALPGVSSEVPPLYRDIQRVEREAVAVTNSITVQLRAGNPAAAENLWNQAKPLYVQWLATINRLIDFKEVHIQDTNRGAMEEASGFLRVMFMALTLALILSAVIAWNVARSIVRQLGAEPNALAEVARRVAQGDLQPVAGTAQAQPRSVLASLGAMQGSLAQVVGNVRHASNAVTQGADEIAVGNTGLLQRTEEQAGNLQQAASSMEQMTASVKHTADAAKQATQLAVAASDAAQKGGEVMTEVVRTMDDISASSHHIADIIGVIDSIAFQTNILALNAAVEAARAGEGGRGFAVVASEVRALAQRSADAARQIKGLIETSVSKVEQGTQLVNQAGVTMGDIVTQAQRVAGLIAEISDATAEQTQGIAQVGDAVSHLDRATQQNAAMVEQSATAAQALKQQAAQLAAVVKIFQLAELAPNALAYAEASTPLSLPSSAPARRVALSRIAESSRTSAQVVGW